MACTFTNNFGCCSIGCSGNLFAQKFCSRSLQVKIVFKLLIQEVIFDIILVMVGIELRRLKTLIF